MKSLVSRSNWNERVLITTTQKIGKRTSPSNVEFLFGRSRGKQTSENLRFAKEINERRKNCFLFRSGRFEREIRNFETRFKQSENEITELKIRCETINAELNRKIEENQVEKKNFFFRKFSFSF